MIVIHGYDVAHSHMDFIIRGMRNSWESWEKGDSYIDDNLDDSSFVLGANDRALALRLIGIGDDHGKYLRQIPIVADITAPEYWWWEFDTYKIGTTADSTSSMHTLGKREIDETMLSVEDVDPDDIEAYLRIINKVREKWIASGKKKATKEWRALVQLSPRGLLFRRTVTMNYQVLRHMYHARKHHRLDEWHTYCDWIQTLPYSEFITTERK